jgi:FMN phosphatase YigB (HAD superfamily)
MQPTFFYFDLGKVLINFSTERMYQQMAEVAGVDVEVVQKVVAGEGLLREYESGRLSEQDFFRAFCQSTQTQPDFDAMVAAVGEIFELNLPMLPLVAHLYEAGYPMGILSNTSTIHWNYCQRHYRILECFDVYALSFQLGAVKPEAAIFHAAAKLVDRKPEEIFFVDDLAQHVAGAREIGFDAVQFTTAEALAGELRKRGIRWNY